MIVSWMTTNQCNLSCKHCYQDAGGKLETELSTEEAKKLIDGIAEAGFRIMIFSGGEPLLRPDIFELVAFASQRGLRPVFGTNGMLITEAVARRLKRSGAMAMGISLDSQDEEKHNLFRGSSQAYQKTLEGMANCRKAGLPFQVHTTVMDWNRDEICRLTDFAEALGAMAHYLFFLIPVGRGVDVEADAVGAGENEQLLREIMSKQKTAAIDIKPTCAPQFTRVAKELGVESRFTRGCLAGLTYCIVSPSGVVRPCAYMTEEAGSVREEAFPAIWQNSSLFQRLRTEAYEGACGLCDHKTVCGGCRARAGYYHGGNYMAEDSYCAYGRSLMEEVAL